MNLIHIQQNNDFDIIINAPIFLTETTNQEEVEIYENMWGISLNDNLTSLISKETVKTFVDTLIDQRKKQVTALNCPATLYF